jgi:hypothetical protein
MNDCDFIQERETECRMPGGMLTGWETVVFQIDDVPPPDED